MANTENHLVRCAVKRDGGVTHIGGTNSDGSAWKMATADAVAGIRSGRLKFYISGEGKGIWLVVAQQQGREVLEADGDPSALTRLPDCP